MDKLVSKKINNIKLDLDILFLNYFAKSLTKLKIIFDFTIVNIYNYIFSVYTCKVRVIDKITLINKKIFDTLKIY